MARKRRYMTAGLIVAVLLAAGAVYLERFAENQLRSAAESYIKERCRGCSIAIANVELSLLKKALQIQDTLVSDAKSSVSIKSARVQVGLLGIPAGILELKDLAISGVDIQGLGGQSVVQRLASQPEGEPEEEQSGFFSVVLKHLEIRNIRAAAQLEQGRFEVSGGYFELAYREDDAFAAAAEVPQILLQQPEGVSRSLGEARASGRILKDGFELNSFTWQHEKSFLGITAHICQNNVSGSYKHILDTASFELAPSVAVRGAGNGIISGTLDALTVSGRVHQTGEEPGAIAALDGAPIQIKDFSADYSGFIRGGESALTISSLHIAADRGQLSLVEPIVLGQSRLSGALSLESEPFAAGPAQAARLNILLRAAGSAAQPILSADGRAEQAVFAEQRFPTLNFSANYADGRINFLLKQEEAFEGTVKIAGAMELDGTPRLAPTTVTADRLALPLGSMQPSYRFSGEAAVEGPLDIERIKGMAKFTAEVKHPANTLVLSGEARMEEGLVAAAAATDDKSLEISTTISTKENRRSIIKAALVHFDLSSVLPQIECGRISGQLDYAFPLIEPLAGEGRMHISNAEAGCAPGGKLRLASPAAAKLNDKAVSISPFRLTGPGVDFTIAGSARPESMSVSGRGHLDLAPMSELIPAAAAAAVRGTAVINFTLSGAPDSPIVHGRAELSNGGASGMGIELSDVSAAVEAQGKTLTVSRLNGAVNGGRLSAQGRITDWELAKADFRAQLAGVQMVQSGTVESEDMVIDAAAQVSGALVHVTAGNRTGTMSSRLSADLDPEGRISLQAAANNLNLDTLVPSSGCTARITGTLNYSFPHRTPLLGDGALRVSEATAGCEPLEVTARTGGEMRIDKGVLHIRSAYISSGNEVIRLAGRASPDLLDISANGEIDLSVLSRLTPLDAVQGRLVVNAAIKGVPGSPSFAGQVELQRAAAVYGEAGIEAEDLNGRIALVGTRLDIIGVGGRINDGRFSVDGAIYPLEPARSTVHFNGDKIAFFPTPQAYLLTSGRMSATGFGERLQLSGTVGIDEFIYEQNISIADLPGILNRTLRRTDSRAERNGGDIGLDVKVFAPGDIVLSSNWAEAELRADLSLHGSTAQPQFDGRMDFLYGFFDLGPRRFEVTSGDLLFSPGRTVPDIELHAETEAVTASLEQVRVYLEAAGPVTDPRVTLSTDSGLSQQETIRLLTSGQGGGNQALVDILAEQAGEAGLGVLGEDGLGGVLGKVTRLDRLAVEPVLNVETGAVEPRLIAEKQLTSHFGLSTEAALAGTSGASSVKAEYRVNERLKTGGGLTTAGANEQTSLSGDISYALIPERKSLEVKIYGERSFREAELMDGLRLSPERRLYRDQLERLEQRAETFYRDRGYFAASVSLDCRFEHDRCTRLSINLDEGPQSKISLVSIPNDQAKALIDAAKVRLPKTGGPADEKVRARTEKEVRTALRRSGYLRTRVKAVYHPAEEPAGRELELRVELNRPMEFCFEGNNNFSEDMLQGLLNIEDRRFPFGPNTPAAFRDQIVERYRQAGYADVEVSLAAGGGAVHVLKIKEGPRVRLAAAVMKGGPLSERRVRELLSAQDRAAMFDARYFDPAQPEVLSRRLEEAYRDAGYPQAAVKPQVQRIRKTTYARVIYHIDAGPAHTVQNLEIEGLEAEIALPELARPPFSLPQLNDYRESVERRLSDAGYNSASVQLSFRPEENSARLTVNTGPRTVVGKITVRGLRDVEEEVVLRRLEIQPGDPWDRSRLGEARRRLHALRLFSDIDVSPLDGSVDSPVEDMLISVAERGLRHLNVGIGFDSVYGLHLSEDGADRSLFGDGKELRARSEVYLGGGSLEEINRASVAFRYSDPFFFSSNHRFAEDLSYQRSNRTEQEFELDRFSLSSLISRSLDGGVSYAFGHSLLREHLTDVEPDVILSRFDVGTVTLGFLSGSLSFDRRDDPLLPTEGFLASGEYKLASAVFGSEAEFAAIGAKAAVLQPLHLVSSRLSFTDVVRGAAGWGYGDTEHVPISQRYYAGGTGSVRGFRENSLGPRGSQGHVIGGERLLVNNLELRYLLWDSIAVHWFLDAGNVYLPGFRGTTLRFSSGLGARYLSPLGPIGLDVGMPLDEKPGEPSVRLHFTIGAGF